MSVSRPGALALGAVEAPQRSRVSVVLQVRCYFDGAAEAADRLRRVQAVYIVSQLARRRLVCSPAKL